MDKLPTMNHFSEAGRRAPPKVDLLGDIDRHVDNIEEGDVHVDNFFAATQKEHPFGAPPPRNEKNKIKMTIKSSLKVKDPRPEAWGNTFQRNRGRHVQSVLGQKKHRDFDILRTGEFFDPEEQYLVYKPVEKSHDSMEYAYMMSRSGAIQYTELCTKKLHQEVRGLSGEEFNMRISDKLYESVLDDETEPLKWAEVREKWMTKLHTLAQPYINAQMAKDKEAAERKRAEHMARGEDESEDSEEWSNDELTVETSEASASDGSALALGMKPKLPRMKTLEEEEKERVLLEHDRNEFLRLAGATRRAALRLCALFARYRYRFDSKVPYSKYDKRQEDHDALVAYVIKMSSDTNWMKNHPFRDWMGIDARNNPFLVGRHLDGTSARIKVTHHNRTRHPELNDGHTDNDYLPMAHLLRLGPVLTKQAEYLSRVVHRVFQRGWAYGDLFKQQEHMKNMIGRRVEHVMENIGRSFGMVEFRGHGRGVEFWFGNWKIFHNIEAMHKRRKMRWKRKIFDAFDFVGWQSNRYRALQLRRQWRYKRTCYKHWLKYYLWCRKFNKMHHRACMRICSRVVRSFRFWKNNNNQVRTCWDRIRLLKKASVFHSLRLNVLLSRYLVQLSNRQSGISESGGIDAYASATNRTLFDYYIVRKGMKRWRKFRRLSRKFDRSEAKLSKLWLRVSFKHWHVVATTPNITWSRLLRWMVSRWSQAVYSSLAHLACNRTNDPAFIPRGRAEAMRRARVATARLRAQYSPPFESREGDEEREQVQEESAQLEDTLLEGASDGVEFDTACVANTADRKPRIRSPLLTFHERRLRYRAYVSVCDISK